MQENTVNNPIAGAAAWIRGHVKNPAVAALLLGGGVAGAAALAWNPVVDTVRSLGRPFVGDKVKDRRAWEKSMDELQADSSTKWKTLTAIGLGTTLASMYALGKANRSWWGLGDWDALPASPSGASRYNWTDRPWADAVGETATPEGALKKTGSVDPYMQDIEWSHPVSLDVASTLFGPQAGILDDGVRLTGTAIVNDAALREKTPAPTLGGIFDSAVDKIGTRLSASTLLETGVKTVLANQSARLFTGALGAVCDLPQKARNAIVDAGTWAGALTAILN